ncbi:solute carrier family 22 member 6-A-like, partial [Nothoprocta perdicaria]|uniref:solute carrier family 22 member 6-A-like n=1 Tax=Nothoprocta perdicaria TaxID=30464 RepID=UPI000E1BEB8D
WDLVCGRRQLRQLAQSIYMAGVLAGALVLGGLSDRFGRKALLLWSYLQLGVTGTCAAFAPSYAAYCALRFASGMALSGFGLSVACLVVEWIPTAYRAVTVATTGFAYTLGQILLAGVAYALPHWRHLQLAVSAPFFFFLLYSCSSGLRAAMRSELASTKASYSAGDLVRTPAVRRIFLCLSVAWFSISFSYYGLAMDLQNFGVSIHLIQVIFGAVDFPAKVLVTVALSYAGRRAALVASLLCAGLVIIANIFVSTGWTGGGG